MKEILNKSKKILKRLLRGFYRALYGAVTAGLVSISIQEFLSIADSSGWQAVAAFIVASATMVVAVGNIYVMGGNKN